jgi:pSer/pThr/pTyr-binding forkhead associated (FHA) protein
MEAILIVVGGKITKKAVSLKKLPVVIGRSREARLTISHPMISRQHCEVFERDGLLMVRDLGSSNGTMVGGQRIREAPLPPDGEFSIGPLTFRARYKYSGDLHALPAPILAEPESKPTTDSPEKKASNGAPARQPKAAKPSTDDPFEAFLEEIL